MNPAVDLIATWIARDSRYSVRSYMGVRHPLDANEVAAIRESRRDEARALPGNARLIALAALANWTPPL